jgi:hypothetical protein
MKRGSNQAVMNKIETFDGDNDFVEEEAESSGDERRGLSSSNKKDL